MIIHICDRFYRHQRLQKRQSDTMHMNVLLNTDRILAWLITLTQWEYKNVIDAISMKHLGEWEMQQLYRRVAMRRRVF